MVRRRRELRERRRRELRLTERTATAGLVDTLPIRPAIEARAWLHCGLEN